MFQAEFSQNRLKKEFSIMPVGPAADKIKGRPLHFIWICDCSGSMKGDKIQSLNAAIRDGLEAMRDEAESEPEVEIKMRVLKFATDAEWEVENANPIDQMTWRDLSAGGQTYMGEALSKVAAKMTMPPMEKQAYPPVLALVTDGKPTDNFDSGLQKLMEEQWGKKAVRIAIAIGGDADDEPLKRFIGNPEIPVLQANNPEDLTKYIRWASTSVPKQASSPPSKGQDDSSESNVDINPPDTDGSDTGDDDVW